MVLKGRTSPRSEKGIKPKNSFIKAYIFDNYYYALIVYGSPVSLISQSLIPENYKIEPIQYNLIGAEGSPLNVIGQVSTKIQLQNEIIDFKALVTSNQHKSILIGTDFLNNNQYIINFSNLYLEIRSAKIPFVNVSNIQKPKIFNVHLKKHLTIPPRSTAHYIQCFITTPEKYCRTKNKRRNFSTSTACFTPNDSLLFRKHNISSANLLVNITQGVCCIQLTNPNSYPVSIYRNQTVGNVETLNKTAVNVIDAIIDNPDIQTSDTGCDIEQLFRKLHIDDLKHLSAEEINQVKGLITKYKDIFSVSDDDISPANVPEHEIVLDTKKPIRTPYRQIPLALKPHAEKEVQRLLDNRSQYHRTQFEPISQPIVSHKKGIKVQAGYRLPND